MGNKHDGQTTLREGCVRRRPKLESNLAEQGLIECRLKDVDAGLVIEAFKLFASTKKTVAPFVVEATPQAVAAWPFQFHPSAIVRCDGFTPAQVQGAN